MTAQTLCFASAKGGSGKTTMTATFGRVLAQLGYRVLMVDCDEATNGLTLLYVNEVNSHAGERHPDRSNLDGVFDRADNENIIPDLVELSETLTLCPATFRFDEKKQFTFEQFSHRLTDIIKTFGNNFDFILLDAQAGSDPVSLAAMNKNISQLVIVVSEYDPLSAAGVERLKSIAGDSLSFDRTWILLNKLLPEFVKSFSEFLSVSHYLAPIPWTADVVRAYARRELALNLETGNEFTLAVFQSLRGLPVRGIHERLVSWTESMAEALRQPVQQQYSDLEDLLDTVTKRVIEINQRKKREQYLTSLARYPTTLITAGAIAGIIIKLLSPKSMELSSDSLKYVLIISGAGLLALVGIVGFTVLTFRRSINDTVELGRLTRQRRLYQSRLEELEFLRTADSASLVDMAVTSKDKLKL